MDLYTLAVQYGTDKGHHGYCPHYERFFRDYQDRTCVLLEMGIDRGSSLRMWRDWLPYAQIVGLDSMDYGDQFKDEPWITFMGDQGQEADLARLARCFPRFDIIIDDAGHDFDAQRVAVTYLWPHVAPGGWYVIEDLSLSPEDNSVVWDLTRQLDVCQITLAQGSIQELHVIGGPQGGDGLLMVRKR